MTLLSEASFLVTPNGYKASKLYAAIPTNGNGDMTFTRATTATRVDENDLVSSVASNVPRIDYTDEGCPSILLEPQRTNLVLRSQEFRNASFQNNLSSVSANTTTAPDGTLTADTWTGDGTSGIHSLAQTVSATSGVAYTQSVFAKKGTNNFLQIVGTGAIYDANSWANFDLENGVVGTAGASATATITDFGNGWYRCTMTATAITTASGIGFLLWLITSATAGRAEGNSLATSVHLWGAQVEEGAYATSYIPTTTGTVTIYDGCPSILLEPQRTNLVKRSQEFDNASWLKYQVSVTANALTAPDGTLTADLATVTSNSGNRLNQAVAVTASTTYTFSFYAKAGTLETSKYSVYDLTNSAYILYPVVYSMTGEWQRITLTFTTPVGCTNIWIYTSHETASGTYYVWGAQLEAGAYPTSYIPTTTGTVTRNADVCVKTGISDLLNPSEGTFYAEISALANDLTFRSLTLSDGTGNNVVQIALGNVSNQIRLDTFGGGASYRSAVTVSDTTENHKVLVKWGPSGIFGFIDGDKYTLTLAVGTGSGIPAALNRINFSVWWGGANFFYGKCKGVQIYKTALSDQQCKALTTL